MKEFSLWGLWTLLQASISHHRGWLGKTAPAIFFVLIDRLGSSCKFTAKSRGKVQKFPIYLLLPTMTASVIVNIPLEVH